MKHTKSVSCVPYVQLWGYTSPMDAEDAGIQYFHSAYCSIPSSPSLPMSTSLNHFLLFKVTSAKIHVKRMARRMEYREPASAGSITASGICQRNQAMGLFLWPQSSWNIVKRNKQVHLVLLELWLSYMVSITGQLDKFQGPALGYWKSDTNSFRRLKMLTKKLKMPCEGQPCTKHPRTLLWLCYSCHRTA
jgi:hypothetical protein